MTKRRINELSVGIILIVFSYLLVTYFSRETLFMNDDNGLQWIPVFESAMNQFLETGRLPQYNFYQLKGYDIVAPGYYGFTNIIMYISYFIKPLFASMVVAYYFLCYSLGNVSIYLLLRKMGANKIYALFFVSLYSTSSVFFTYSYWYYSANNYWIYPMFYLLFISVYGKRSSNFVFGLLMSVALYMGNAQFAMYFWMFVFIVMVTFWIFQRGNYYLCIILNFMTAVCASLPAIYSLWKTSQSSVIYQNKSSAFFYGQSTVAGFFNACFSIEGCNSIIFVLFLVGVIFLLKKYCYEKPKVFESLALGTFAATLFYFLFLIGVIAPILYKLPVISNFRYLFKIFLVLPGCYLFLAAVMYVNLIKKVNIRRMQIVLMIILLCINCGYSLDARNASTKRFGNGFGNKPMLKSEKLIDAIKDYNMDLSKYRFVNLVALSHFGSFYDEVHNTYSLLPGNLGTTCNFFSLGGYDNTYNPMALYSIGELYSGEDDGKGEMFSVRNTVYIEVLLENICSQENIDVKLENYMRKKFPQYQYDKSRIEYIRDSVGFIRSVRLPYCINNEEKTLVLTEEDVQWTSYKDEILSELVHNGVKYMIFDLRSEGIIKDFLLDVSKSDIEFSNIVKLSDDTGMIELNDDVIAITTNQEGESLENNSSMDCIDVHVSEKDTECQFSFVNNGMHCFFKDGENTSELEVLNDEYGNMYVDISQVGEGIVSLQYYKKINVINIISGLFLSILFLVMLVKLYRDCKHDGLVTIDLVEY